MIPEEHLIFIGYQPTLEICQVLVTDPGVTRDVKAILQVPGSLPQGGPERPVGTVVSKLLERSSMSSFCRPRKAPAATEASLLSFRKRSGAVLAGVPEGPLRAPAVCAPPDAAVPSSRGPSEGQGQASAR